MTGMDDLVQWLRAQLDKDERTARAAGGAAWEELPVSGWVHTSPLPSSEWQPPGYDHHVASAPLPADRAHIVAHDPARVLREIDAKRKLLDDYTATARIRDEAAARIKAAGDHPDAKDLETWDRAEHEATTLEGPVKLAASPLADRPGYREDWRP